MFLSIEFSNSESAICLLKHPFCKKNARRQLFVFFTFKDLRNLFLSGKIPDPVTICPKQINN